MKSEFKVKGFHCKSCKMLVEDVAEDFSEIQSCTVDVDAGKVLVEHADDFDLQTFKDEIEDLGDYKVVNEI